MNSKKRNKKQMSVEVQMKYRYTLMGGTWMMAGVCQLLNTFFRNVLSKVLLWLSVAFMVIALFLMLKVQFARKEISDEMAKYHLLKAESITLEILQILFSLALIVVFFIMIFTEDVYIDWKNWALPICDIVIGTMDLLIGLNFHRLEAE